MSFQYSTFIGAEGNEVAYGMAPDPSGKIVAVLSTTSLALPGSSDPQAHGGSDCLVALFDFRPPHAAFEASVTEGGRVDADGSASTTPAGTSITSYDWDWGDGTVTSGQKSSFTFPRPGRYPVTLKVTNDLELTAASTRAATVPSPKGDTTPWRALSSDSATPAPRTLGAGPRLSRAKTGCTMPLCVAHSPGWIRIWSIRLFGPTCTIASSRRSAMQSARR